MSEYELIALCRKGDTNAVRQMIEAKCDVDADIDGVYPLLIAIQTDNLPLAEVLINADASMELHSSTASPLRLAIAHASLKVAELLISTSEDISIHDVVEAACHGNRAMVSLLVRKYESDAGGCVLHDLPWAVNPAKIPLHQFALDLIVKQSSRLLNKVDLHGWTPLRSAVAHSNPHLIKALVKAGARVNVSGGYHGRSLLMVAAEEGDEASVKALLTARSALEIDAKDDNGASALHLAVRNHLPAVVDALVGARADVNVVNSFGRTPLFYAKSAEVVQMLLVAGADINHRDRKDLTPLLYTEDKDMLMTLINSNADVGAKSDKGRTLLARAVANQNMDMLQLLLATPATAALLNEQDDDGRTAVAGAALKEDLGMLRMLVAAGANLNIANKSDKAALHVVKNTEIAQVLIEAGADCNLRSHNGSTPLISACARGAIEIVTMLLVAGARADLATDKGVTALIVAVQGGHAEAVDLLLQADTSPGFLNARAELGKTALFIAVSKNASKIVNVLVTAGADVNLGRFDGITPLMMVPDVKMAELLVDHGAEVNSSSHDGHTALTKACSNDKINLVSFLLDRGADITAVADGYTTLMLAARKNCVSNAQLLLQAPGVSAAWVNTQTESGATALRYASAHSSAELVEALVTAGADVNLATESGKGPLHVAANADIARILWEAGARNVPCNKGWPPLLYACKHNRADVAEFLLKQGSDINMVVENVTPLITAARHSHVDTLRVLLAATPPADVNLKCDGLRALSYAVSCKSPLVIRMLLDAGADPRLAGGLGFIPLMPCSTPEGVRILVDAAPDTVNRTNDKGRSPVQYMLAPDRLDELFSAAADHNIDVEVNHKDVNGDTALHMAMLVPSEPEVVELLLEIGAEVFGTGYGGTTVLMKPFLSVDEGVLDREYRELPVVQAPPEKLDALISDNIETVIYHVLSVGLSSDLFQG